MSSRPRARKTVTTVTRKTTPARPRYQSRASSGYTRRYAVRGRGGYWDNVKKRWGEGGGKMHSAFQDAGGIIGGPVGRQLGGLFNRGLYALTGFGDYQIRKNSLWRPTVLLLLLIRERSLLFVIVSTLLMFIHLRRTQPILQVRLIFRSTLSAR